VKFQRTLPVAADHNGAKISVVAFLDSIGYGTVGYGPLAEGWRQQPATEKQTALLHKLGLAVRVGLTKGEAADLLAAVLGDWG